MLKDIISASLVVTLLAGCATMSDETRTKTEGTAVGAGVGAVAGGVLGYLLGGKQGAAIGAGAGAALGAGGGYLYGTHVANRKKEYAREEIVQLETETAQLIQRYNQRTIQRGELKKQELTLTKKVEEGQKQLQILQAEIDIQQKALAKEQQIQNKSKETVARLKSLQDEITRLEDNKAKLDGDVKKLATIQIRPSV